MMVREQYWPAENVETVQQAKILVVEDDVNLLDGLRSILELDAHHILTAENGLEALEMLRSQSVPPDLILSDIMMPRMDGLRFLEEVRKQRRWVSIPFIYLTARGENVDVRRGRELGVEDYIVKPYDPDNLRSVVRGQLRRSRMLNNYYDAAMTDLKQNILKILNHEFRTPLTFVVAYADMLNLPQLTEEERIEYLRGVSTGAARLRRLVENFILLVDLELKNAQQTFEWRRQPVTDVLTLLQQTCSEALEQQGIQNPCEIVVEENLPVFIGDTDYLKQAIIQLLDNAVKFSPDNSPVKLGAKRWRDGEIALWVEDRGRGIPTRELQNILQSFYQIDREHYEDQGAGSGLAIVKGITQLHGGRIGIESAPGEGSTFYILLPTSNPET